MKILAAILLVAFNSTPLEWNVHYRTDVPYELSVDPARLGVSSASELQVSADGKPLPTISLQDPHGQLPVLRFSVPSGTKTLSLGRGLSSEAASGTCCNIASGIKWQGSEGFDLSHTPEGVLLTARKRGRISASGRFAVPGNCAGKPVAIELDCKSLTRLMWTSKIRFRQYDKGGNPLPETLSDARWTTHYRPCGTLTPFREKGYIHPAAASIDLEIEGWWTQFEYDEFGRPLDDPAASRPVLLVSHLSVRPAAELPFPKYRDAFFGNGVSGAEGDCSLNLGADRTFWFCTRSHASWAGSVQIREESQCFYPAGAGTVEAWFKPRWEESPEETVLLQAVHNASIVRKDSKGIIKNKRAVFAVSYTSGSGLLKYSLKDVDSREFKGSAKLDIPSGKWFHIAATWQPDGEAVLYIDGSRVMSFPLKGYKGVDLRNSEFPNDDHAMEFYLGSDYRFSRVASETDRLAKGYSFYSGEADALRISSGLRYNGAFTPAREFALDTDTRALFNFDRSYDGVSGGGIGWISGTLRAVQDRLDHKFGDIQYYPEELPDSANPDVQLVKWNTEVAREADFAASEKASSVSFNLKAGESRVLTAPKGVFTDYVEIANEGSTTLKAPIVLRDGDVDVRSYGDIASTLFLPSDSDFQKANRIFNLLLRASDYFMSHNAAFAPGSNTPYGVEYDSMELLNSYCGFECGPLNNLAALLFTSVAGFPACYTRGYGHSFEQVFFDGKNHTYDLSAQRFFPMMNNELPATLGEMEEQPYINFRWGSSANHFIRGGSRPVVNWAVKYPARFSFDLNPGEKMRFYWVNDGQVNDLQSSSYIFGKKDYSKYRGFEPFYEQTGTEKSKSCMFRVNKHFPEYGNAFFSFDGVPSPANPAFTRIEESSFCYSVNLPYPIVAASYTAVLNNGRKARLELSVDGGRTFVPFESPAVYKVRARKAYLVKVCAPISSVKRFTASTEVMTNSRMLMGALREGDNSLTLKMDSEGEARITYGYREPASEIIFKGARPFGTYKGCTKQLVLLNPSKGALSIPVSGISGRAAVSVSGDLRASLSRGVLKLVAKGGDARFAHVTVTDGDRSKTLTVLVCNGARMIDIDSELREKEDMQFDFEPLPGGKYALLTLARCTVDNLHPRDVAVSALISGRAKELRAVSCINHSADFYKKIFGREGEKGAWRWDFPIDPKTGYPYGQIHYFPVAEGTSTIEFKSRKDIPTDLACAILLPECSDDFTRELYKTLFSLNHRPWLIHKDITNK